MSRRALLVACLLAPIPAATMAITPISPPMPVPVLLGNDPNMDACPSMARPNLPRGGADGFLSLRAGPGTAWPEIARLRPSTLMFECEGSGIWAAVIVRPDGGGDCAIPTPARKLTQYKGPCRHGWVARRYLETVAG